MELEVYYSQTHRVGLIVAGEQTIEVDLKAGMVWIDNKASKYMQRYHSMRVPKGSKEYKEVIAQFRALQAKINEVGAMLP